MFYHLFRIGLLIGMLLTIPLPLLWAASPHAEPPRLSVAGKSRALAVIPDLTRARIERHGQRWTHQISISEASFLKPHFVNVKLRQGDVLTVRSASGQIVEEITGRGPKKLGTFWGLSTFGNTLFLEFIFSHPYRELPFHIDQVIVGDSLLLGSQTTAQPETVCGSPDFDDAACVQNQTGKWANARATVGILTVDSDPRSISALFCTGANVSPNNRILTNQHCMVNQAECDNSEFIFDFRRTGCNNGAPFAEWKSFRCDQILTSSPFNACPVDEDSLDFALTSVLGDPAVTFGSATLDSVPVTSGENVYILQHPDGRPLQITEGGGTDFIADDVNLRYFNTLDTEPGSSGSPLFRAAGDKLVGLHHCGSNCDAPPIGGNTGIRMSDLYPQIAPFLCTAGTLPRLSGAGVTQAQEFEGNGDTVIDPGETWQMTPRLHNSACTGNATQVAATVRVNPASTPVTLLTSTLSFGQIAAGRTVNATTPVRFKLSPTATCGGKVSLDLVNITSTSGGAPNVPAIFSADVGSTEPTTLLFTDFSTGTIPVGWTVTHAGTGTGPTSTWMTTNPGNRTRVGATPPFAIVDPSQLTPGQTMDERLVTPFLDARNFSRVELQFAHDFKRTGTEIADVDVSSSATGGLWQNVARFTGTSDSGTQVINLTAWAAGRSDVRVRFRYYNASFATERWWVVDDISLLGHNGFLCNVYNPAVVIFADGFESGSTSAWDATVGSGANIAVTRTATLAGNFGLQLTLNNTTTPFYVQDNSPINDPIYRARFYFDLSGLTMGENDQHQIFAAFREVPLTNILNLVLRFESGQYHVRAKTLSDANTWIPTGFFPISKGRHVIEVKRQKATSPGANNGQLRLWIDNVLRASIDTIDNDQSTVDFVRLGAVQNLDLGTSGTMYFDRFESRRQSVIGP